MNSSDKLPSYPPQSSKLRHTHHTLETSLYKQLTALVLTNKLKNNKRKYSKHTQKTKTKQSNWL